MSDLTQTAFDIPKNTNLSNSPAINQNTVSNIGGPMQCLCVSVRFAFAIGEHVLQDEGVKPTETLQLETPTFSKKQLDKIRNSNAPGRSPTHCPKTTLVSVTSETMRSKNNTNVHGISMPSNIDNPTECCPLTSEEQLVHEHICKPHLDREAFLKSRPPLSLFCTLL